MSAQRRTAGRRTRSWDNWPARREGGEPLREGLKTLLSPPPDQEPALLADAGVGEAVRELGDALERLTEVVERLEALPERTGAQVALRLHELQQNRRPHADAEEAAAAHLLFVPSTSGYQLVEREGAPPAAGAHVAELEAAAAPLVVVRVGPSPLPGDGRRCAYLEEPAARDAAAAAHADP